MTTYLTQFKDPALTLLLYLSIDLNDIGSIPYALARPFLLKVESPEKLVRHLPFLHLLITS